MAPLDVLLTNVRVVRHDLDEPQRWDVGVVDGKIAEVGPGIDPSRAASIWAAAAPPQPLQGVAHGRLCQPDRLGGTRGGQQRAEQHDRDRQGQQAWHPGRVGVDPDRESAEHDHEIRRTKRSNTSQ